MIKSGEKKEEYREIKDFWIRRLVNFKNEVEAGVLDEFIGDLRHPGFRHFDFVEFRNGYGKNVPSLKMALNKIMVGTGREAWGADPFKFYFVLKLGKVVS